MTRRRDTGVMLAGYAGGLTLGVLLVWPVIQVSGVTNTQVAGALGMVLPVLAGATGGAVAHVALERWPVPGRHRPPSPSVAVPRAHARARLRAWALARTAHRTPHTTRPTHSR